MRRIKLTIAYDGTDFSGWQVQPDRPTIQGILEEIFLGIEGAPVHVAGSGRTDAGVHALGQVAAVTLSNPIPLYNLRKAVNRLLPPSIRILAAEEVPEAFHPRYDAVSKTYEYRIVRSEVCSPFERRYVHHHPYPLNEGAMIEAAPLLAGTHDFSAFAATDDRDAEGKTKVRTIFESRLERIDHRLIYRVTGSGFLKHMVRNLVGALLEVGKANLDRNRLIQSLSPPFARVGATAPASGLFLVSVTYGDKPSSYSP